MMKISYSPEALDDLRYIKVDIENQYGKEKSTEIIGKNYSPTLSKDNVGVTYGIPTFMPMVFVLTAISLQFSFHCYFILSVLFFYRICILHKSTAQERML